jgi:hypothetical protein
MKKYIIEKTVSTQAHTQALEKALKTVTELRNELLASPANTLPENWDSVVNSEVMTDIAWSVAMTTSDADWLPRNWCPTASVRHGISASAGYLAGYYNILELLMMSFASYKEAELHYFNYAVEMIQLEIDSNS